MKKIVSMLVATTMMGSMLASFGINASAYYVDNDGGTHNYYSHETTTISNPDSYFPSGYSWVTAGWKDIYLDGGVAGTLKPYYNRQAIFSDKAKEITAGSMTGVYYDGSVTCNGVTSWSSTQRSTGSETGTVSCNGSQSVTYRGNVYWD